MRMVTAFTFSMLGLAALLTFCSPFREGVESSVFGNRAPISSVAAPLQASVSGAIRDVVGYENDENPAQDEAPADAHTPAPGQNGPRR